MGNEWTGEVGMGQMMGIVSTLETGKAVKGFRPC